MLVSCAHSTRSRASSRWGGRVCSGAGQIQRQRSRARSYWESSARSQATSYREVVSWSWARGRDGDRSCSASG